MRSSNENESIDEEIRHCKKFFFLDSSVRCPKQIKGSLAIVHDHLVAVHFEEDLGF